MTESMHGAGSIGQQLKQARQARNLGLDQVTEAIHIRAHYLRAMEDDDFDALPSPVQARGFLRLYADYLGLSLEELIAKQRGESLPPPPEPAPSRDKAEEKGRERSQDARRQTRITADKTTSEAKPEKPLRVPPRPSASKKKISEPKPEPAAPAPSQGIFLDIGAQLRQHREALGLALDEVERHIHVRRHYLEALEAGDFAHLPTSVQARGMLNNYAHFLDLPVDAILLRFAEGLQAQRLERQQSAEEGQRALASRKRPRAGSLGRFISMDLLFGGGLILLLILFAVWGTKQVIGLRAAPGPASTAPSISDVLLLTPTPGGEAAAPAQTELITPSPTGLPISAVVYPTMVSGHVQVIVIGLERTWVRVTVDGKVKLEGRIQPGSAHPFDGSGRIEVLTGDGSAVKVIYNQTDLGVMGTFGEVVDIIFTPQDILRPTATPLPTATATPRRTQTPSPTPTRRVTSTPTPTQTIVP